jgi:zinc D-Ala-D-Ala carboxypeptidase
MSKYFKYSTDPKLACSCCGGEGMDEGFLSMLDRIREEVGGPLIITSGYRCPKHNSKVSSSGNYGSHTTGRAVDISVTTSSLRHNLVSTAYRLGIPRVGVADTFIHLDDLGDEEGFSEDVMWTY